VAKLREYNKILDDLGYDRIMYEDFVDATLNLLEKTAASLPNHDGGRTILETFNDTDTSSGIICHFRVSNFI